MPLEQLKPFQGELKSLSKDNYAKLKAEILELGFSEPVSVWVSDEGYQILNGHQRVRVLQSLRGEGFEVPEIPISLVEAVSYKEAKKKVLALTSQYGKIEGQGLYEFMGEAGLDLSDLEPLHFADLDIDEFKAEFFEGGPNFQPGTEDEQGKLDQTQILECPECGAAFERSKAKIVG